MKTTDEIMKLVSDLEYEVMRFMYGRTTGIDKIINIQMEIKTAVEELAALNNQKPVAYLAWRDGKPCWSEDCVCQDAVWPADGDDDRTSMPVYLAAGVKEKTE